jgi:hypothetical protein
LWYIDFKGVLVDLSQARYKNLRFIQKQWNLTDEELSLLFKVEYGVVLEWHRLKTIKLKDVEDIIESLMGLYEMTSERFKNEDDLNDWFITPLEVLDKKSPLQVMLENPLNINLVKMILNPL